MSQPAVWGNVTSKKGKGGEYVIADCRWSGAGGSIQQAHGDKRRLLLHGEELPQVILGLD